MAKECWHTITRTKTKTCQGIVVLEFILYALFGIVQLLLPWACCCMGLKGKNRTVEVIYICLSAIAKFLLGTMLFANVLFA